MLGGCKKTNLGKPKTIYETISQNENYSFLSAAVTEAGLKDALEEKGKTGLTLFAPDNNAFIAAGIKGANDLAAIPDETLKAILLYRTNVAGVLSGTGPFTVFAPTNQAFINAGFPTAQAHQRC